MVGTTIGEALAKESKFACNFSHVFVGAILIVVCSTTLAGSIVITKVRWMGGFWRVVYLLAGR